MSESNYQAASFLDHRALLPGMPCALVPWPELQLAARGLESHCHFIFHISHAGSTLISRLLGLHPSILSLREPAILRLLGRGEFTDRLDALLALWSRTFHSHQRAVIKATSFVSEIGGSLLERVPNSRAILVYVPAATFLPALLDGAMSDIRKEAHARLARIQKRGYLSEVTSDNLSPGELVAMSWLAEMLALREISTRFPDRVLWMNFDQFLCQPERQLHRAFEHIGLSADVASYLSGPTMQRYAKRPEARYDSVLRERLLEQGRTRHAGEIRNGIAWLQRIAASSLDVDQLARLHTAGDETF